MKFRLILTVLLSLFTMSNLAFERPTPNEQQVQMKKKSNNNPHSEWNIPADMPDVYYNYVSGTITIVDYANVTYYVTIYDDWWNAVITDTKVGGGTIDVSSLSTGDYTIDITTSWNNQYEGEFTVP